MRRLWKYLLLRQNESDRRGLLLEQLVRKGTEALRRPGRARRMGQTGCEVASSGAFSRYGKADWTAAGLLLPGAA